MNNNAMAAEQKCGIMVFGCLMSDYWDMLAIDADRIVKVETEGVLFQLPYNYPVIFPAEAIELLPPGTDVSGVVKGEMMTFCDGAGALKNYDLLEGYDPGGEGRYTRARKDVTIIEGIDCGKTVSAWTYVFPMGRFSQTLRSAVLIPHGDWRRFMEKSGRPAGKIAIRG